MADYQHPPWLAANGVAPWTPGQWGKGFLHPEGLTTWGVGQAHDGYPFHSVIQGITGQGQKMAQDGTYYGEPTADIWINPEGKVAYWNRPGMDAFTSSPHLPATEKLNQIGKQITQHDHRLHSSDDWIDNQFYPQHRGNRLWPCPRCGHPESNADGSCPHCNYRPENDPGFERATASDPTPLKPKYVYEDRTPDWKKWWNMPGDEFGDDPDYAEQRKNLRPPKIYDKKPKFGLPSKRDLWHEWDDPNFDWADDEDETDGSHDDWDDVTDFYKNVRGRDPVDRVMQDHMHQKSLGDLARGHQQQLEKECPECGEPLNEHGDCENSTCYASPDFYGYKDSSWHPTVVESQSHPITVAGENHHRADRRPVVYLPHRNTVYVGNPACHHAQLRNEFEIPRHSGCYGYIRPGGVDWLNGVGMPDAVDDILHSRYVGNGWEKDMSAHA